MNEKPKDEFDPVDETISDGGPGPDGQVEQLPLSDPPAGHTIGSDI